MVESNINFDLETPYAITKLLGEQYVNFWVRHHKLNCVMIRIFNNYGPGELPGQYRNVVPNFFHKALNGQPLIITGTGKETRDFNYVDDTTNGILLALFKDTKSGDLFNIGSGRVTSILDVATMINEVTGNKGGIIFNEARSWDHVTRRLAVIGKAKEHLGYNSNTKLRDRIEKTYEWMLKYQQYIQN